MKRKILTKMIKNIVLFIIVIMLVNRCKPSGLKDDNTVSKSTIDYKVVAEDAAWCWFSDPRAVYHKGAFEKVYFGYINMQGDVVISTFDIKDKAIETFVLHEKLQVDDHNNPSIIFLPDHRLIAFYNEHSGNVYMRKSRNPEDIHNWEDEQIISKGEERYCYTNPVMLSEENNRIYIFGRKVGTSRSYTEWWQYFIYSDNEGETWSDGQIYLDNEGRNNPIYLKLITDHKSRIDFVFSDGHPKIGSDVSVYHMYYEGGVFYQTNGDILMGVDSLPVKVSHVNKVYDAKNTNIRAWIWDLALNKKKNPVIVYARYPIETDHRYHYAYWDGQKWIDQEVSKAGGWMPSLRQGDQIREAHYSGGIVLNPIDPKQIYLSRQIEGKFEIERKYLQDNGKWKSSFITSQSEVDNIRPYVVYNSQIDRSVLLWMSGYYNHYTRWDTNLRIKD